MEPIHRWLTFADSWSPAEVQNILAALEVEPGELVYEPFVGCGTTPLACTERGVTTLNCDASRLAVFVAQMKLQPPTPRLLDSVERRLSADGVENLLRLFSGRNWPPELSRAQRRLLQFVFVASLLRVGWHEGVGLDLRRLQTETATLLAEMRNDLPERKSVCSRHYFYCRDFWAGGLAAHLGKRVVMVSSPPFFGSNVNPAKRRLADLLGRARRPHALTPRTADWQVAESHSLLSLLPAQSELFNQAADYLFFLDSLAARAAALDCRAVALEMGARTIGGQALRFDLFLAECLAQRQYSVEILPPTVSQTATEPEAGALILARRR